MNQPQSDADFEMIVREEIAKKDYDGDLAKATKIGADPFQAQQIYIALRVQKLKPLPPPNTGAAGRYAPEPRRPSNGLRTAIVLIVSFLAWYLAMLYHKDIYVSGVLEFFKQSHPSATEEEWQVTRRSIEEYATGFGLGRGMWTFLITLSVSGLIAWVTAPKNDEKWKRS